MRETSTVSRSRPTAAAIRALKTGSRRRVLAASAAAGLVLPMFPLVAAAASGNDWGSYSYVEQAPPVAIGKNIPVTEGTYDGGYSDFTVENARPDEVLSLKDDGKPATVDGSVSVVDGTVYLGNGATADPVGTVDPSLDGQQGRTLRVNFTSPFANPSFESGDMTGWTAINQRINLGTDKIAGHTTQDTSTYSTLQPSRSTSPDLATRQDDVAPQQAQYRTELQGEASDGVYGFRLVSNMTTGGPCDVVHGPAVYSDTFKAAAGDKISFDWRAFSGADAFHVFGYIVDQDGQQTALLDASGSQPSTPWVTKETAIPADGTYRFVFVSGTFDQTCGQAAGASLIIDNVRVYGTKVKAAVVQDMARKLQYGNSSDRPEPVRNVDVAVSGLDGTVAASGSVKVNIAPVDDEPSLGPLAEVAYTNTEGAQDFENAPGTLQGTDPDGDSFTYGIEEGMRADATIAGNTYTHSRSGNYGTLYVNSTTGRYLFVPAGKAIDARRTSDAESFTMRATAAGKTIKQVLRIRLDVPASAPAAPGRPTATAGPKLVELSWEQPDWTGGSATTGYRIEKSTDNGTTWQVVEENTGTAGTSYTARRLTNGAETLFRVFAINANGTGPASGTAKAVPHGVPGAPEPLTVDPGNGSARLEWAAPADDGGAGITGYRIEHSPDGRNWKTAVADTGSAATSRTFRDLPNGTKIVFRVSAINAAGTGAASGPASAMPRTVPGVPGALRAVPANKGADLTWTAPADDGGARISGYRIEQWTDGEGWQASVADTGSAGTSYRVRGLANGEKASFRVSAINAAGPGPSSAVALATPQTVPDAPKITRITTANRALQVSFDGPASDGGAEITGYEYSVDEGTTWITAGTADPLVIGGLVNGTHYRVMIRAVNAAGSGAASSFLEASPVLQPVPDTAGNSHPDVAAGTTQVLVDGVPLAARVSTDNGTWKIEGDGFTVELEARNAGGAKLATDAEGRFIVTEDGTVQIQGTGFKPGSSVDVWMFSTPYLLGEATVGTEGTFSDTFDLPEGIKTGPHTVQLNGLSADNHLRSASTGLVVLAASARPQLAYTGFHAGWTALLGVALLGAGAAATMASRRRSGSSRS